MAVQEPGLLARLRRQGLGAVAPHDGLAVLATLLSVTSVSQPLAASSRPQPTPAVLASPLVWPDVLLASSGFRATAGLYAEFALLSAPTERSRAGEISPYHVLTSDPARRARSPQTPADDQHQARSPSEPPQLEVVAAAVLAVVHQVLGASIEPDQGLMEVRCDSCMSSTDPDLEPEHKAGIYLSPVINEAMVQLSRFHVLPVDGRTPTRHDRALVDRLCMYASSLPPQSSEHSGFIGSSLVWMCGYASMPRDAVISNSFGDCSAAGRS